MRNLLINIGKKSKIAFSNQIDNKKKNKVLKFEGDLHPLMSHLLYFKLLLASLRPVENQNEN